MRPDLFHIGRWGVPTHETFLVLGIVVALALFRTETKRRGVTHDERLRWIVLGGLLCGALFARLSTGWRYLTDEPNPSPAGLWLYGGKSLLGGLAGAYFGVVATKLFIGYRSKTGDLFTPGVVLGIAIGRIGCFLEEPPGTPTSLPWGIKLDASTAARIPGCSSCAPGVRLHPSFLYEILFLLALFALLRWLRPRLHVPGEQFKIFLLAYGVFRFAVEFVRENPRFALGLSGSQVFLLITLPILFAYFARQLARGAYRRPRADAAPILVAAGRLP